MFLRPPPVRNKQGDSKDARLEEFINTYLGDFDIICFQEIFSYLNNRRAKLVSAARKAGYKYHVYNDDPSYFNSSVIDGGLLIVS
jgi:hypothetical protein